MVRARLQNSINCIRIVLIKASCRGLQVLSVGYGLLVHVAAIGLVQTFEVNCISNFAKCEESHTDVHLVVESDVGDVAQVRDLEFHTFLSAKCASRREQSRERNLKRWLGGWEHTRSCELLSFFPLVEADNREKSNVTSIQYRRCVFPWPHGRSYPIPLS